MRASRWHSTKARAVALDRRALVAGRTLPHTPEADGLAVGLSRAADHAHGWMLLAVLGALVQRPRAARWLAAGAGVVAVEQLSRAVKRLAGRERPQLDGLPPLASVTSRYSLPSSHTATAFAALSLFDGLAPRRALLLWAALTAASRPYLGVHYPSDVAAGALIGWSAGRVLAALGRARRRRPYAAPRDRRARRRAAGRRRPAHA